MKTLITLLLLVPTIYLALSGLYQLILALASQVAEKKTFEANSHQNRFLVMVPAYKEDAVIIESTRKNMAMRYQYHKDLFDYMVVADGLQQATISTLKKLGAQVVEVDFKKSTKVKSLCAGLARAKGHYDGVVILDADNVARTNFLRKANDYLNAGYVMVQGQRTAANAQTVMACLDGFSEAANNAMLCKGANRLGLSSKLCGSAMVCSYPLFQRIANQLQAIGGFDKEMELLLTQEQCFIKYAEDLVVEDQKVASFENYQRQRGRWLESQYSFLKKSFQPACEGLFNGNIDYFHKALQLALPPRALAPLALMLLAILGFWLSTPVLLIALGGFMANLTSYLITIPSGPLFKHSWGIMKALPALFWSTCKALTWMKRSRTEFLHTQHQLANT